MCFGLVDYGFMCLGWLMPGNIFLLDFDEHRVVEDKKVPKCFVITRVIYAGAVGLVYLMKGGRRQEIFFCLSLTSTCNRSVPAVCVVATGKQLHLRKSPTCCRSPLLPTCIPFGTYPQMKARYATRRPDKEWLAQNAISLADVIVTLCMLL